ncbi:MAG: alpha/beta hydrolase [Methylocystis sp.]|nr:alpha/beta hydrolase [Methylocystis sp.]MCA3586141.1 alpha/beta hydrolase [Methylocystis sp.]MCA3589012.1 alpha/beta hydrolase [Methylocystis sp.]MCA3592717.1 alpha/beta hydrolase [Methylocystis sp.]
MKVFDNNGAPIAYIDMPPTTQDRGEPILLIHGFASTHAVNWLNTLWVKTLTHAGRRVIALDNRGHGESVKLYRAQDYVTDVMAGDAAALLNHLGIERADVMGYSMGARITAFLALGRPDLVRSAILGGLGIRLVEGVGLPAGIADALEASSLADVSDPMGRMFRAFADANKGDLAALAACIRGTRQTLKPAGIAAIKAPVLVCVGTNDPIAGDPHALAALFPNGRAVDIPGRDHNLAVGDKVYKQAVLDFLETRP